MATGGMSLSKEFFELLKSIGESKSKQEEDRIIAREVSKLKSKMEPMPSSTPGGPPGVNTLLNSKKRAKEFLVRLLYVHMLGHEASFGLIKAVEMAASASLYHKRTGYLVCTTCLPPDHEFRFMLVNQMQRDLHSANVLECSGGILACSNIITADMVPAVASEVTKLLSHDSATIRKKAIICLHRFHQLAPEVVPREELQTALERVLCDKDPSVMGSCLNVVESMAAQDPGSFKHIVSSLVAILKQIGDRRLPADYDYHRIPAPWMQLKLVRILAILGRADAVASSGMYEIVADTLKKADSGINAGYAVVYECVKCIVTIYPNTALLEAAAEAISRFIQSRSHNLKYLGVTGLAMIVESHPQYAAQHQLAVMDCLEDPDETLQRKTLDLLYRMANPVNVEFITEKLVAFLSGTTDLFLKKVLTTRVCSIAERYAPNNSWYVGTISKLFEVSGDMVSGDVAQNLMSLIAEGTGESEEADMLLRQNAVEIYVSLLQKPVGSLPRILLETMAWCLGEYGYLSTVCSLDEVLSKLCRLASTHKAKATTRKFLVTAILKLIAQAGSCPQQAAAVIDDYTRSQDVDLQQRCLEFQNFLTSCPNLLPELLPVDASAEDVQVDKNLSFLDGYVQDCLSHGARPYEKPEDDDDDEEYGASGNGGGRQTGFNMTPYEKPQTPAQAMMAMSGIGSGSTRSSQSGVSLPPGGGGGGTTSAGPGAAVATKGVQELSLNTRNVANVWGRGGMTQSAPSPVPSSSAYPTTAAPVISGQSAWESHSAAPAAMGSGATYSSGTGFGSPPPAPAPAKTAEQLEKERQAAALFGGMIPGAPPPPPSMMMSSTTAVPPSARAVPSARPSAPPPAPPPVVDLLDMSLWDDPAPAPASTATTFDHLSPLVPTAAGPPMVETVSDDEDSPPVATAAVPIDVDPFASAGLLGDVHDSRLQTLSISQKFEYNGTPMAPLQISTAQFGQQWGSCPFTSPLSISSSKPMSLDQFMNLCGTIGAHKVEAITASNEGIAAGMVGASQLALIHAKLTPLAGGTTKIDATIKSTDSSMSGSLAMYLQTMLR
jgi:AP-4 complex subunit epsilon-1